MQSSEINTMKLRRMNPSRQCPSSRWFVFTIALLCSMSSCRSFHISMNYKPPVKSSVKKLHDRRFPSDQTGNNKRASTTGKSAYANAYSLSSQAPSQSFERRMRDLVLGSPQTQQPPAREGLPPNVHVVENLQDYKKVVGDEEERIVAVRFYATYCRVRFVRRRIVTLNLIELYSLSVPTFAGVQSRCPAVLSNGGQISQCRFCRCPRFTEERRLTSRPGSSKFTLCAHLPSRRWLGRRAQAYAKSHS